jgi:hypothetical protein
MEAKTKAQQARQAIRTFKTTVDALALRGYYRPSGRSGQTLAESLRIFSPEIYGSMNDHRIIELKGLEYVLDRLPRGIEECIRIILTAQEDLEHTSFDRLIPVKRRRTSYRVSETEMSFVITRGMSEIYDILTHVTFLNNEAEKIHMQMTNRAGEYSREWLILEEDIRLEFLEGAELDRALWNLSIILGRTFSETKETYLYLEEGRKNHGSNRGLFQIIYSLGKRAQVDHEDPQGKLMVYFTPSLKDMIGSHRYGRRWATAIKEHLLERNLQKRPLHIISANMHSVMNGLYGYAVMEEEGDFFDLMHNCRERRDEIRDFALLHGLSEVPDAYGTFIDCQVIDTSSLCDMKLHSFLKLDREYIEKEKPVVIIMDYAFGAQAYEVMDELLSPLEEEEGYVFFTYHSISIMGKAGILPGKKGDIMLATAHVFEGTPHNYMVNNDLNVEDFRGYSDVYEGPIVTVLGTSLQNRDVLEKFQLSSWKAVGLEMEGGHYQRAVNAAMIRNHISRDVKIRYAYYASDNPLQSGETLASGGLGDDGIRPTYMITAVILEKVLGS